MRVAESSFGGIITQMTGEEQWQIRKLPELTRMEAELSHFIQAVYTE
jgi:hypothetical protein